MYVRQADATIAFAGEDSGVPNRLRPAGVTVLDSIWQREAFTSRDEFLDRVADIVVEARQEGVLGRSEAERRSEEHTSELQSRGQLVCRLLLEKNNVGSRTTALLQPIYALLR